MVRSELILTYKKILTEHDFKFAKSEGFRDRFY